VLLDKVDNDTSTDSDIFGFNFQKITFKNWGHCIPIGEHFVFGECTLPNVFGFWELIIGFFFFIIIILVAKRWEELLECLFWMLAISMFTCVNVLNSDLERLTALSAENISLGSFVLLENSGVSDDTVFLIFLLISLSECFVT